MGHLIDDVAAYLQAQGVGTVGTSIFKSYKADVSASTAVFVLETTGLEPSHYLPQREPTFQIFVKASNYAAGRTKCDQVRTALHNKYGLDLVSGGTYCYFIRLLSEGGHIGKNERGQDEFSMNFQCRTRQD